MCFVFCVLYVCSFPINPDVFPIGHNASAMFSQVQGRITFQQIGWGCINIFATSYNTRERHTEESAVPCANDMQDEYTLKETRPETAATVKHADWHGPSPCHARQPSEQPQGVPRTV